MDSSPNKTRDVNKIMIKKVGDGYVFSSFAVGDVEIKTILIGLKEVLEEVEMCFNN